MSEEIKVVKHVSGLVYDTETSELLGKYKKGSIYERLYKTPKGRYFVVIDKELIPVMEQVAKDWLGNYAPEKLAVIFPNYTAMNA